MNAEENFTRVDRHSGSLGRDGIAFSHELANETLTLLVRPLSRDLAEVVVMWGAYGFAAQAGPVGFREFTALTGYEYPPDELMIALLAAIGGAVSETFSEYAELYRQAGR